MKAGSGRMNVLTNKKNLALFWLVLLLMAGGAVWYLAVCTSFAPWGFSDTATYFSSARNLAKGIGLGVVNADGSFAPLQVHAPLYSIVLSPFAAFGLDLIAVSRILDLVFFAALIISCGWLFYRISESWLLSLCFAGLIATTPIMATNFTSMMSEPLSIVLGLPGFLLLLLAIKTESNWRLLLAGLLTGLSFMARYAFAAVPLAGVLVVIFLARTSWSKRLIKAVFFGAAAFLPMGAWMLSQWVVTSSVGSRQYSLAFSLREKSTDFFSSLVNVTKYWFPYRTGMIPGVSAEVFTPFLVVFFLVILMGGFILSLTFRRNEQRQYETWLLMIGFGLLIVVYLGFLFLTYSISSMSISLDDRMFSPLAIMFYAILLAASLSMAIKIHPRFNVPVAGVILSLFFLIFSFLPLRTYLINMSTYPDGYASPEWKGKPIFDEIEKLPEGTPLISNGPDLILFYTNRPTYYLSRDLKSWQTNVTLADTEKIRNLISNDCGAIVLFNPDRISAYVHRPNPISDDDILALEKMFSPIYESTNGEILIDLKCIK